MARGLREVKHSIWRTNEVLFGGFLEERLDEAKYEGMREGGVKGKQKDQSDQKGKMLARESAVERESERKKRRSTEREREKKREKESRDPFSVVEGDWQVSALEMLLRVTRPHNTAITHWL